MLSNDEIVGIEVICTWEVKMKPVFLSFGKG